MAITITDADSYVQSYFIDNKDWFKLAETRKQTILNVAERALTNKCDKVFKNEDGTIDPYVLPDEAVYEFSAILSIVYNDTNKMQQYGIAGFSVTGVGSFTFKEQAAAGLTGVDPEELIPPRVLAVIGKANDKEDFGSRTIGWLVL